MQCWGRTRTLKRCRLEGSRFFCHHHRWTFYLVVLTFLLLTIPELYQNLLKPAYQTLTAESFRPPEFTVVSTSVDLPSATGGPLSLSSIQNRRRHLLSISNPNRFPLTAMEFSTQWPESILSVRAAEPSASYSVVASEAWDRQPLTVSGDVPLPLTIEPFASEEKTGLWHVTVSSAPSGGVVRIEFLSVTGPEGGMYAEEASELDGDRSEGELLWLIDGRYQYATSTDVETGSVLLSLEFDRKTRVLQALPVSSGGIPMARIELRHGRGGRIPGILRTRGYLVANANSRDFTTYTAPVMLESTRDDLDVKFGLFGSPPTNPGFVVTIRKSLP